MIQPQADNAIATDHACLHMPAVPRSGIVLVKRDLRYTTNPVQCRGDAVTLIRSVDIEKSKSDRDPGNRRRVSSNQTKCFQLGLKPRLLLRPPTGTGSILILLPLELLSTLPGLVTVLLESGLLEGSEVT